MNFAFENPSAIEGQTALHLDVANETLSAMLNEFAGIRKVSNESLGRDEMHVIPATKLNSSRSI